MHLLGLALIGGAVLAVDLRLLRLALRRQPVAQVARDAQPWLIGSLIVMVATGSLLFMSEAMKCYYHPAFWEKMTSLFLAIIFTFTIQRKVIFVGREPVESRFGPRLSLAVVSLALWSGVGIGGRWIGFS